MTVHEHDREKIVPIRELSVELGLFPEITTEEISEEEQTDLFQQGKEAQTIILDLKRKGLITLFGEPNPYYGSHVGITDLGIQQLEDSIAGPPLMNPIESKQRQLLQHEYNLNWLKEQAAKYGESVYLHNQIEDEKRQITELQNELSEFYKSTTSETIDQ